MAQKKRILVLVDWYVPGYKAGGPIRSVANIVDRLSDEFCFSVVTRDTDYLETTSYSGIESNKWIDQGNDVRIWYFSSNRLNRKNLYHLLLNEEYDAVYLNSFFSFYFSLLPLCLLRFKVRKKVKVILAPRGMLAENALNIKRIKKRSFLYFAKMLGLHNGVTWHASSQLEAAEIRNIFPAADVKIALNLPSSSRVELKPRRKAKGEVRLFFLSRIAVKKNLLAAIEAVNYVNADLKVQFDIFGPVDEKEYWDECTKLISQAPGNVSIDYQGAIENIRLHDVLSRYHFMLFPTLNENYGHVILESLSAGCPVIISDQTPWRGLEQNKAGWDLPLGDVQQFVNTIEKCAEMDQQEYDEWSKASFNYASGFLKNDLNLQHNRELFQ